MLKKFLIGTMALALMLTVAVSSVDAFSGATLRKGSGSKADVMELQTLVGAEKIDGIFGNGTEMKVKAWQATNGLTADGVFGPASMAKAKGMVAGPVQGACPTGYVTTTPVAPLFASCVVATPAQGSCPTGYVTVAPVAPTFATCAVASGTTTTPVVGKSDGELSNFDEVSTKDSTLEEGATAEVFGFTVEVEGDVVVDRLDVYIESEGGSADADDYFESASLLVNGTKVATVDVSDFDEVTAGNISDSTTDQEYKIRFSGLSSVFKDGDKPKFVVAFEANNVVDSVDQTASWTVATVGTDAIRYVDGKGFSDSFGGAATESFSMDAQKMAKVSINSSSNDLKATIIEVSDSDETKEVTVFKFELEEENDVDATIEDMTLTIETGEVSGTTDESAVVSEAFLYQGSTLIGSESVSSAGVAAFENLKLKISGDDTEELTLKLTFADQSGYAQGTSVKVYVTSITDAKDANGNDESDIIATYSANSVYSEVHTLRTTGLMIKGISEEAKRTSIADASGEFDQGTYTLVFELTAFGDDVYVDNTTPVEDNDGIYVTTSTSYSISNDTNNSSVAVLNATSGDFKPLSESWLIKKGKTARFTLEVTATASADSSASVTLENIGYAASNVTGTTSFLVPALSEYQTNSITLLAF